MFFKRRPVFLLVAAFAAVLALNACGLYTGEKAPKRTPPSYSGKGFSCVGRIPEHIDKYVNDRLSNEEITEFVSCLQKAFTTFAQLTRGRSATAYAPDEIRKFLHDFFLGDRRVSDQFMAELMVLKQTMLGGQADAISRDELYAGVEMLEEFKNEALRLKPHLKVLNARLAKTQDPATLGKRLLDANEALNATIATLSKRLQRNQQNYALANLQNLMTEFRVFAGWESHFPSAIAPAKWVNFLRVFRQLTVAPNDSAVVRPVDWMPMLQSFTRWYLVFLQHEIGVKDQPILRGVGLQNVVQLGQELFTLLEQSASRQDGLTITFEQINEMTLALYDLRWLPPGVRPESIAGAMKAVVTRMLGDPEVAASMRKADGLNLIAISRARDVFFRWAYIQINLDTRLAGALAAQKVVPNVQIKPYLTPDVRMKLKSLGGSGWDDFLSLRTMMRPLFAEGSLRISLVRKEDLARNNLRHNYQNLTMMNLWRTAAQLLFRGYAEQAGSRIGWDSGIAVKEMEQFYADFREIGIDLKLVDVRNPNPAKRDFMSGNLFTYSADGMVIDESSPKARLRLVETMELFSFMLSGSRLATELYDFMGARCAQGPGDVYKRPTLSRKCVLEQLPAAFDHTLAEMPDLQQFLRIAPIQVRNSYARTLLESAFNSKNSLDDWVELNELITLAVVLHYAEAVMTNYDVNRDGTLTNTELDKAADIFSGFIKKFQKEKKNQDLSDRQARGVFYYILTYREMPDGFWDIAYLTYVSSGTLSLNRSDLSMVFRVFIAKLFETGKKPEAKPAPAHPAVGCQGMDIVISPDCGKTAE